MLVSLTDRCSLFADRFSLFVVRWSLVLINFCRTWIKIAYLCRPLEIRDICLQHTELHYNTENGYYLTR